LNPRRAASGFRFVIANIAVFYGIILFEIFTDETINENSFFLSAIYSGIMVVEVFAAVTLRKLTSAQSVGERS
jgi:hypothetical protein